MKRIVKVAAGVTVAVMLVTLAGVGLATLAGGDDRSPEATVAAFFEARQEGDCEELLGLVSEASWSGDGQLTREDFRELCVGLVSDYQPELHDTAVLSEDDGRALVRMAVRPDEEEPTSAAQGRQADQHDGIVVRDVGARQITDSDEEPIRNLVYEEGNLVREDGEWKVELDGRFLRFGRSAEETMWGFLEAYRDGNCHQLVDYVSDAAWSDGGVDREDFVERCDEVADARQAAPAVNDASLSNELLVAMPAISMPDLEISQGAGAAVLSWSWSAMPAQTIDLVVEGLEWKLADPGVDVFDYAELGSRILDEALGLREGAFGSQAVVHADVPLSNAVPFYFYEGSDAHEHRRRAGFMRGLMRVLDGWEEEHRRVELLLYEFADAQGARSYADHFGARVVANATRYNDDLSPVPVPGVEGAVAILTECTGPGDFRPVSQSIYCDRANRATAVASHDRFVVAVEVVDFEGEDPTAEEILGDLFEVVEAQLGRL